MPEEPRLLQSDDAEEAVPQILQWEEDKSKEKEPSNLPQPSANLVSFIFICSIISIKSIRAQFLFFLIH